MQRPSNIAAAGAGLVLAATAYTAYYYVVYIGLFTAAYLLAWSHVIAMTWAPRPQTPIVRRIQRGFAGAAALFGALSLWIAATGGAAAQLGPVTGSLRAPQNP